MPQLPEAHRLQHRKAQILQLCLQQIDGCFTTAGILVLQSVAVAVVMASESKNHRLRRRLAWGSLTYSIQLRWLPPHLDRKHAEPLRQAAPHPLRLQRHSLRLDGRQRIHLRTGWTLLASATAR
jgi:hypothetical protein